MTLPEGTSQLASSHHADAVPAEGNLGTPPVAWSRPTGWRTSEIALVVANDGSLVLQPAFGESGSPIGVIRSADEGRTWDFVLPSDPNNPPREIGVDQDMIMDRATGRIFWVSPGYDKSLSYALPPSVSRLDISDDNGRTWSKSAAPPVGIPDPATGQPSRDHPQIFTGPPPENLRHKLRGYPSIVYVCQGNAPQLIGRSFDGGMTFEPAVSLPFPPEIPGPRYPMPASETYNTNFGLRGVVDHDGTVYLPNTPGNRPYVAISRDAGETWHLVLIAETVTHGFGMLSAGLDADDVLYVCWIDAADRLPYLCISRDHGLHWSAPQMVGAPGVKESALPSLVAGASGQVAITYYGSLNSPGRPFPPPAADRTATGSAEWAQVTWNTYLTQSFDALAKRPVFWSAPLNDPACPTWYGASPSAERIITFQGWPWGMATGGATAGSQPMSVSHPAQLGGHVDYYGITMAPDGTPWVGFYQACVDGRPVPGNPYTNLAGGKPTDALFAMVGRMTRPKG